MPRLFKPLVFIASWPPRTGDYSVEATCLSGACAHESTPSVDAGCTSGSGGINDSSTAANTQHNAG